MDELPPDFERLCEELGEHGGGIPPVTLSPAYLRALVEIEGLTCNQSGQDKSWVLRAAENRRRFFTDVRRATGA